MTRRHFITAALCCFAWLAQAKETGENIFMPEAPDYGDPAMWITLDLDTAGNGADIFYVVSTWEEDWQGSDGRTSHWADVWNPIHRARMAREIRRAAAYMAPGNRFCAPYYRHTTMEAWLTQNEDTISRRLRLAMQDVCEAFDRFCAARDKARPLVIAGFSQGARAVVTLLKHMSDETCRQLVAAYVLGYKVTEADMEECPRIRPAQGEKDTGVTVCYNTVKDVKYVKPVIAASAVCINPVNWRTDATPATIVEHRHGDTLSVKLDTASLLLLVDGYRSDDYMLPLIGCEGNYHCLDITIYRDCLRRNIALRASRIADGR